MGHVHVIYAYLASARNVPVHPGSRSGLRGENCCLYGLWLAALRNGRHTVREDIWSIL